MNAQNVEYDLNLSHFSGVFSMVYKGNYINK